MPAKHSHYYIPTFQGILIIVAVAAIALTIFGVLYYYWIETPMNRVPEIFNLSRVAKVNLNANLKTYLGKTQADFCAKDSDCPDGFVCYTSRECSTTSQGIVCGQEFGDLLCHKKCMENSDCPKDMPVCQETKFLIDHNSILIKICQNG